MKPGRLLLAAVMAVVLFGGHVGVASAAVQESATDDQATDDQAASDQATSDPGEDPRETVEDEIDVVGSGVGGLGLESEAATGSRLGLTLLEIPASVDLVSGETMQTAGHKTIADAVEKLVGVMSGDTPSAPSAFSIRGFGYNQITFLRDGVWYGPTSMVARPQNTFNLERVEVLRGPSSALYGQGSVGGVVNAVTKKASPSDQRPVNLSLTYGRFDTMELGLGAGGPLGEKSWYRFDASHHQSDGFVERMDPRSTNVSGSLLFAPRDDLDVRLSVDYLDDDLANYWGTPLTPRSFTGDNEQGGILRTTTDETLDRRILRTNYNVLDGVAASDQTSVRVDLQWQGRRFGFEGFVYRFDADREWANAEGLVFNRQTELIDRTNGFFFVLHDQQFYGMRSALTYQGQIGYRDHRMVVGVEASDLDFERTRGFRFSQRPGDSVSVLNPDVGVYGGRELRGVSPTQLETQVLFIEDRLEVTDSFSVLVSLRGERLDLVRENYGRTGSLEAGSSFSRDFEHVNWKVGGVYQASDSFSIFGQFGTATDPVNSNLFLVNANQDFDLTEAEQWELGAKGVWHGGRAEASLALYGLSRDDVLAQIAVDSASVVGGRDSEGIELTTSFLPKPQLRISFNAAYTDAEFRPSPNFVTFAGNRPTNVPEIIANLSAHVSEIGGRPLQAGIDVRYVDDRFGDHANTVTLEAFTLADAFVGYHWGDTQLTLRVKNLADEVYVAWADDFHLQKVNPSFPYANQVHLGSPRTYEINFRTRF